VRLLIFTRGERSTQGLSLRYTPEALAEEREREALWAGQVLGLAGVEVLRYPDLGLREVPRERLVEEVLRRLEAHRPRVVLTFHPNGLSGHPDHIAVSEAVTEAFRRACGPGGLANGGPARLFYFCIPEEVARRIREELGRQVFGVPPEEVTPRVPVADCRAVQESAVRAHRTQATPFPPHLRIRLEAQREDCFIMGGACPPGPAPADDLFGEG